MKKTDQPGTDSPIYDDATVTLSFSQNDTETNLDDLEEDIENQDEDDIGVEYHKEDDDLKRRISMQHLENEGLEGFKFLSIIINSHSKNQ